MITHKLTFCTFVRDNILFLKNKENRSKFLLKLIYTRKTHKNCDKDQYFFKKI